MTHKLINPSETLNLIQPLNPETIGPGYDLVFFSPKIIDLMDQYMSSFRVYYFDNFSEWERAKFIPSAFIILGNDLNYISLILSKLRRDNEAYKTLCFVTGPVSPIDNNLIDGQLPQPSQLQQEISRFQDLSNAYKNNGRYEPHLNRLIKYLWLRSNLIIQPIQDLKAPRSYRYPLLEVIGQDKFNSFEWLKNLIPSQLLEPVKLVDRRRECLHCSSYHMGFIKVCPKCNFEVQRTENDYDILTENYSCHLCNQIFSASYLAIRCSTCKKTMRADDLISTQVHNWKLSNRAMAIVVRGETFENPPSFNHLNSITKELFIHNLDWSLASCRRYQNATFSLFGIKFSNLEELINVSGYTKSLQMVESLAQKLRNIIRPPDLSTRTSEDMLWLLLPHTNEQGLDGFNKRIVSDIQLLQEEEEEENESKLDCKFIGIVSTQMPKTESAELLLARLYSELS